jgi:hypothetical protein
MIGNTAKSTVKRRKRKIPAKKTTTRSARRRNARGVRRRRRRNTRNTIVVMKALKKTITSVVLVSINERASRQSATGESVVMSRMVAEVADMVARSAQAMVVVVRKAADMVLIRIVLAVVAAAMAVGKKAPDTEVRRVQAMDVRRVQAMDVRRVQAMDVRRVQAMDVRRVQATQPRRVLGTVESPMTLPVVMKAVKSRLVTAVVVATHAVMTMTSMGRRESMEEESVAMAATMMKDTVGDTELVPV